MFSTAYIATFFELSRPFYRMSRDLKSPLLKKRAMDALLESMTTDSYDSLGAHRRGESTPEQKGTEFGDSLNGEGFSGSPAIIPPDDLKPPSGPEDAEFFKESQPKIGVQIHRNTKNRAHGIRCAEIAKAHPEWDASKVEAQATLVGLGVKPIESVLADLGVEKESREITPVEDDMAQHEFVKEAPFEKYTHEEVAYESPSRHEGQTCAGCTMFLPPNGCTGVKSPIKAGDWCNEFEAKAKNKDAAAGKTLYHVTSTDKVPGIKAKGILPLQTSNWVKGDEEGERYGEGEIFAMDNPEDAVRWAAKMDWEFNKHMGSGKISIVVFTSGAEKWKRDTSDPISQAANKGHWLKAVGSVKPEQIKNSHVLTPEMVKSVIQGNGVKLADVPTKSYGMGTPIGGTDNPDAGASDEPEELQDPAELSLNMTSSAYEDTEVYLKNPPLHRPRPGESRGYDLPDSEHSIGLRPSSRKPSMEEQENMQSFENDSEGEARIWASEVDGNELHVAMEKIASTDNVGWWSKSARPTDQKIELLAKQFKLNPEQIELCIAADPSPQQKDFVAWIAKWFSKGQLRLPEDNDKLKQQLGLFQKLKKSPQFQGNKDVQTYDPPTLFQTIEENAGAVSKKEQTRRKVTEGSEVIVDNGDLVIYKVWSPQALMQLSGGTNWCTAHNSHASRYLKDGPSYVFFKNDSAFAQLHPASDQLMNRADVCMVEDLQDTTGQTIAKFVNDPTALRGLKLLSAVAPDVAAWVKENATDPGTIAEILGKKMQEEQSQGTTSREMTVRHAMATNTALPPEQEATLPQQGVDWDLLFKYGEQFHAGSPWAPLEKLLFTKDNDVASIVPYIQSFRKGQRWPVAEKFLLKHAMKDMTTNTVAAAINYAAQIIKGRWDVLESEFHLAPANKATGYGAAKYAIDILKQRWADVPGIEPVAGVIHEEELIKANPRWYADYSKTFMPAALWDEFRDKLLERSNLYSRGYEPEKDIWVVRQWSDVEDMVRSIGDDNAYEAMEFALEEAEPNPQERRRQDLPDEDDMAEEMAKKLSYNAMRTMGKSLQQEEPDLLENFRKQNRLSAIDFTSEEQMLPLLKYVYGYAPGCSVWRNIIKAYEDGAAAQYKYRRIDDLKYAIDEIQEYSGGEDRHGRPIFTDLRFGKNFDTSFTDWNTGPVSEVIDRNGAMRMLEQIADESPEKPEDMDISDGQLSFYVNEADYDDDSNNEEAAELMDRWYTQGIPQDRDPRQQQLQFQSSLLKKKALIQMNESPTMLPPRDDIKGHMDQQEQDLLNKDLRQGVVEPLNPKKKKKHRQQIDPRINPHGVAASKEAANPNITVRNWRRKNPFPQGEQQPISPFIEWIAEQAREGRRFSTIEEAQAEYDKLSVPSVPNNPFADIDPDVMGPQRHELPRAKRKGQRQLISPNDRARKGSDKTADEQQDWEQDEQAQYFLEQVEEAGDEAKRYFMQEAYLKQIAQDDGITMDELWDKMGDEYTAEFYGTPYKRVDDFTNQTAPDEESKNAAAEEKSEVRIRFKGKEEVLPMYKPEEIMKAVRHAEFLSMANPGFPVVFILDEAGIISEDTYINGNWVGPTVEKFAFQAAR